ncbi:MAG: D-alanine--D-alanine ligase [Bacteroidales bacterium]|nr:D-alanine--D-alanine ligase [Bacteroidales bacterium]
MKKNIALVMGGYSGEHDVSIASGSQVYGQLDHQKYNVYRIVIERQGWYWLCGDERREVNRADFTVTDDGRKVVFDLAFVIVHGNPGENGVLQGYFDMLGVRYTTCGFYTSSLTFHKGFCNPVVASFGLAKVARSVLLFSPDEAGKVPEDMRYPLFVKPATGGSSVATTKVKSSEGLAAAIAEAFTEAAEVLVEEGIAGREFDCGVMRLPRGTSGLGAAPGGDTPRLGLEEHGKLVFPVTEIIPIGGHEFFDYEAKYEGFSREVAPAEADDEVVSLIQHTSSRLYDLLGCRGIVRFDYIYNTDERELYFLEVNTIPGQSAESIVPKQARAMGLEPATLYELAIEAALEA